MTRCRYGTVLTALVTTCLIAGLASTSASAALPEFSVTGTKVPVSFTLKTELGQGARMPFRDGLSPMNCSTSIGTGSITGAKEGTIRLTFEGCRVNVGTSEPP